jgi:hypothetical protein
MRVWGRALEGVFGLVGGRAGGIERERRRGCERGGREEQGGCRSSCESVGLKPGAAVAEMRVLSMTATGRRELQLPERMMLATVLHRWK